MPKAYLIVSCD